MGKFVDDEMTSGRSGLFGGLARKIAGVFSPSATDQSGSTGARINPTDGWINVALTGTSNCVLLKGLSSGIAKHPDVREFQNRSQGASGTVAIAAHLHDFDFSGLNYVFIEYCINESAMLKKGTENLDNTFKHFAAMIDRAASNGCVPILVNYPTLETLGRSTQIVSMLEREFVARGVAMFDVQKLLESRAATRGVDVRVCFRDTLHLKRPISFAIGSMMIDATERARKAGAIGPYSKVTDAEYGAIGYLPATDLVAPDAEIIDRENYLLKASMLSLSPGDNIRIPLGEHRPMVIRGVAYNAARSLGSLSLNGTDTILQLKRSKLFGTERDLMIVNQPAALPGKSLNGEATVKYVGDVPMEDDTAPMAFELAGFIVHYPDVRHLLHVVPVKGSHRQLQDTLADKDFAALDSAWDAALRASKGKASSKQSVDDFDD